MLRMHVDVYSIMSLKKANKKKLNNNEKKKSFRCWELKKKGQAKVIDNGHEKPRGAIKIFTSCCFHLFKLPFSDQRKCPQRTSITTKTISAGQDQVIFISPVKWLQPRVVRPMYFQHPKSIAFPKESDRE